MIVGAASVAVSMLGIEYCLLLSGLFSTRLASSMRVWINDLWVNSRTKDKTAQYGRGSRWQVAYYAESSDGARRLVSKKFRTKPMADEFRTKTDNDLREGLYQDPQLANKTVAQATDAWWDGKKRPSGASMKRYRDALDIWVLPMWATRRLHTIQKVELDHWLTALASGTAPHAADRRVNATGLSPSSIKAVWVPFKASLATAVELGWLAVNPAQRVETTKSRRPESIFLSYLEVDRLVAAAMALKGELSDAMMVELMAFAGLRPGEVVALQVQDVDVKSRRIKIRRTMTIDITGAATIGEPKHGERRDVPIAPHLIGHLQQLMEGKTKLAPLISSVRGHPVNIHNWRSRVWNPAVKAACLDIEYGPALSPKALRHTAASMAIAAGADVKVIQRMLGHADASMTLNTYADLWPDRLDEVTAAVSVHRDRALSAARS